MDSEYLSVLKDITFIGYERIEITNKSPFFLFTFYLHYPIGIQVATVQGLSGTGSLRLAAALIERYFPGAKVLISAPTWGVYFIPFPV